MGLRSEQTKRGFPVAERLLEPKSRLGRGLAGKTDGAFVCEAACHSQPLSGLEQVFPSEFDYSEIPEMGSLVLPLWFVGRTPQGCLALGRCGNSPAAGENL